MKKARNRGDNMYCQSCGKEIEERTEKCPYCESVIPNVYVPDLYSSNNTEESKEKPVFTIKAVKPEKKLKCPSPLPIKITSIIMYGVLFAYYLASSINDFINSHPYGFKSVLDCVFAVMFGAMLLFSIKGKIDKKLSLISLCTFILFEAIYNIIIIISQITYLSSGVSIAQSWYMLAALILRLCAVISMTVVLVFAFIFYLKKKFSPLPMCISTGIFLIFELIALIFNIVVFALGITPIDIFIILSLLVLYTYMGITIAQLFLFHIQDKYKAWLEENSI